MVTNPMEEYKQDMKTYLGTQRLRDGSVLTESEISEIVSEIKEEPVQEVSYNDWIARKNTYECEEELEIIKPHPGVTMYKMTDKMESTINVAFKISAENYYDAIEAHETSKSAKSFVAHEVLLHDSAPCVPYYDFDEFKYATEEEQKANFVRDYEKSAAAVKAVFGEAYYIWTASVGKKTSSPMLPWVNSFHCVVRGKGWYDCGALIPKVAGSDPQAYKAANKRQQFRMFGGSKDTKAKRPFKLVIEQSCLTELKLNFNEPYGKYALIGATVYRWLCEENHLPRKTEAIDDVFVQNVRGELYVDLQIKESTDKYVGIKKESNFAPMPKAQIAELIGNLDPKKCGKTYEDPESKGKNRWHKGPWILRNYANQIDIDLIEESRQFRALTLEGQGFAGASSADRHYNTKQRNADVCTIATLIHWSMEDNLEGHNEIMNKYYSSNFVTVSNDEITCFNDRVKFANKKVKYESIVAWVRKSIVRLDFGGMKYFIYQKRGTIDNVLDLPEWVELKDELSLIKCCRCACEYPNPNYKEGSNRPEEAKSLYNLSSIISHLLNDIGPDAAIRLYSSQQFIPYNKVPIKSDGIFNMFNGFPINSYVAKKHVDIKSSNIYKMIHEGFCNSDLVDPGLTKHFLQNMADMLIRPHMHAPYAILLQTEKGSNGRGTFSQLLEKLVGARHYNSWSDPEAYYEKFNTMRYGRIARVWEDVGEIHNRNAHQQRFKAEQTAPNEEIEPKNGTKFSTVNIAHLFVFSNFTNSVQAQSSADLKRWMMLEICEKFCNDEGQNQEFWNKAYAELSDMDFIKAFFEFLSNMDLSDYNREIAFDTEFKRSRKMADLDLTLKHLWWYGCSEARKAKWTITTLTPLTEDEYNRDMMNEQVAILGGPRNETAGVLYLSYKNWADTVAHVTSKIKADAYNDKLTSYGLVCKQLGREYNRITGHLFSLQELQDLLIKITKNKNIDFMNP